MRVIQLIGRAALIGLSLKQLPAQVARPESFRTRDATLRLQLFNVTNGIGYVSSLLAGSGGFATNYSLLSTNADTYINGGLTNVSIRQVVGTVAGTAQYWNVVITNGVSDRTLEFSSTTNAWHFAGAYGTNAPNTLTNNTQLLLSGRSDGTNTLVGYSYFSWP